MGNAPGHEKVNHTKPYAVDLIESALTWNSVPTTKAALRRIRPLLPYCFIKLDSAYVLPVNRDYMPLGVGHLHGFVNYSEFQSLRLASGDLDGSLLRPGGYLFNDSCSPLTGSASDRSDYLVRLWWSLRRYGFTSPKTPIPVLKRCAARCGIEFRLVLKELA